MRQATLKQVIFFGCFLGKKLAFFEEWFCFLVCFLGFLILIFGPPKCFVAFVVSPACVDVAPCLAFVASSACVAFAACLAFLVCVTFWLLVRLLLFYSLAWLC